MASHRAGLLPAFDDVEHGCEEFGAFAHELRIQEVPLGQDRPEAQAERDEGVHGPAEGVQGGPFVQPCGGEGQSRALEQFGAHGVDQLAADAEVPVHRRARKLRGPCHLHHRRARVLRQGRGGGLQQRTAVAPCVAALARNGWSGRHFSLLAEDVGAIGGDGGQGSSPKARIGRRPGESTARAAILTAARDPFSVRACRRGDDPGGSQQPPAWIPP